MWRRSLFSNIFGKTFAIICYSYWVISYDSLFNFYGIHLSRFPILKFQSPDLGLQVRISSERSSKCPLSIRALFSGIRSYEILYYLVISDLLLPWCDFRMKCISIEAVAGLKFLYIINRRCGPGGPQLRKSFTTPFERQAGSDYFEMTQSNYCAEISQGISWLWHLKLVWVRVPLSLKRWSSIVI